MIEIIILPIQSLTQLYRYHEILLRMTFLHEFFSFPRLKLMAVTRPFCHGWLAAVLAMAITFTVCHSSNLVLRESDDGSHTGAIKIKPVKRMSLMDVPKRIYEAIAGRRKVHIDTDEPVIKSTLSTTNHIVNFPSVERSAGISTESPAWPTTFAEFIDKSENYFDQLDQYGKPRPAPLTIQAITPSENSTPLQFMHRMMVERIPEYIFQEYIPAEDKWMYQKSLLDRSPDESTIEYMRKRFIPVGLSRSTNNFWLHRIGNVIGKSNYSVVYALPGHGAKWAIKYNAYCGDDILDQVESILREVYFLTKINNYFAQKESPTHQLLYYSAPADYDPRMDKFPNTLHNCLTSSKRPLAPPLVRYMITEVTGRNLFRLSTDISSIRSAGGPPRVNLSVCANIGKRLMVLLKQIHSLDMVHGDLHLGNIVEKTISSRYRRVEDFQGDNLILIDFGRAREVNDSVDFPYGEFSFIRNSQKFKQSDNRPVSPQWTLNPYLLSKARANVQFSPWESVLVMNSYRDDVFRAVSIIASIFFGSGYSTVLNWFQNQHDKTAYLKHKFEDNLFDCEFVFYDHTKHEFSVSNYYSGDPEEKDRIVDTVVNLFEDILTEVRVTKINEKPNHDYLIKLFEEIATYGEYFQNPYNEEGEQYDTTGSQNGDVDHDNIHHFDSNGFN